MLEGDLNTTRRSVVEDIVARCLGPARIQSKLQFTEQAHPYLTPMDHPLIEIVTGAVQDVTGKQNSALCLISVACCHACAGTQPELNCKGGTSDGRFIHEFFPSAGVVELGPSNATIHQTNECVPTDHLEQLSSVYERIIRASLMQNS